MKAAERRIPDVILEQYMLGELPPDEEVRLRTAIESDPELERRLKEIETSNKEILETYPPRDIAARILDRLGREKKHSDEEDLVLPRPLLRTRADTAVFRRAALPIAAALVIFAGAISFHGLFQPRSSDLEITRAKGGVSLRVFRKTAGGSEELRDGAAAVGHDIVQLRYSTGGLRYGTILSIDGRGTITFHVPPAYSGGTAESPELDQNPGATLDSAYELDDAPSFERFFLVLSDERFPLSEVYAGAKKLAERADAARDSLPLGPRFQQKSFLLKKSGGGR